MIIWNIRGVVNSDSIKYLRNRMVSHNPKLIILLEPKQSYQQLDVIARIIGFSGKMPQNNTTIWISWREDIDVLVESSTDQGVTFTIQGNNVPLCRITAIYANCNRLERESLWQYLTHIGMTNDIPWIVGDDFNTILSGDEKKGGNNPDTRGMQDFRECIINAGFSDAVFNEMLYQKTRITWLGDLPIRLFLPG